MTTIYRGRLSGHGYVPPGGEADDILTKTSDVDGECEWRGLGSLSVEYLRVKSFGAVADGSPANAEADTTAVTNGLQAVADAGGGKLVFERGEYYLNAPMVPDVSNLEIIGDGATITGDTPTLLASFSGADEDLAANNQLLGGAGIRTNQPGSLEDVRITGLKFANGVRAIHMTGFTRRCEIDRCSFDNFSEYDILLNGSWSFSVSKNRCNGDEENGTGIALGIIGEGTRSSSVVCNVPNVNGNWSGRHAVAFMWNFGVGGFIGGNTFERNRLDGARFLNSKGFTYCGNYHEFNLNDNLQVGGTGSANAVIGSLFRGNFFSATTGSNIRLNNTQRCVFGPNHFSGTRTQHYTVQTTLNTENEIWVPDHTATYISGQANLDGAANKIVVTNTLTTPTVRGSKGGNTAVTALLSTLQVLNIIVDGTSA